METKGKCEVNIKQLWEETQEKRVGLSSLSKDDLAEMVDAVAPKSRGNKPAQIEKEASKTIPDSATPEAPEGQPPVPEAKPEAAECAKEASQATMPAEPADRIESENLQSAASVPGSASALTEVHAASEPGIVPAAGPQETAATAPNQEHEATARKRQAPDTDAPGTLQQW